MQNSPPLTAEECIAINRMNLRRFADEYLAAANLFVFLERLGNSSNGVLMGPFVQFRIVAAREAVLSLYHFGCALAAIKSLMPQCRGMSGAVELEPVEHVLARFRAGFPNIDTIRHAIAHAGETFNDPRKASRNRQKADAVYHGGSSAAGGLFLISLYERTFTLQHKGDVFSFIVDEGVFTSLLHCCRDVENAFQAYAERSQPPS